MCPLSCGQVHIEGTIGHDKSDAIGGLKLINVVLDDLAKPWRALVIAAERLHQQGNAGLVVDNQLQNKGQSCDVP